MTLLLELSLLMPIGAAVIALLGNGRLERILAPALVVLAFGAAVSVASMEAIGDDATWRGFQPHAWSAVLAAAALLCAAVTVMRATDPAGRAAAAIAGSGATAMLFAPDSLWLGLAMVVSSLAVAAVYVTEGNLRARTFAPIAISDLCVLAGLVLAGRSSLSLGGFPGTAGALVLTGGLIRLVPIPGLVPTHGVALAASGIMRAQGALLVSLSVGLTAWRGTASLIVGSVVCIAVWAAGRSGSLTAGALALPGAAAAIGFGIGGAAGLWGAIAMVVAGLAALVLEAAPAPAFASISLGLAPIGGLLLGFALIGGAAVRLAASRPQYAPVAIALLAASFAVPEMLSRREPRTRSGPLRVLVVACALGVVGFLSVLPRWGLTQAIARVGGDLSVATPLSGTHEGIPNRLALAGIAAGVAGFLAGGERMPLRGSRTQPPRWASGWASPPEEIAPMELPAPVDDIDDVSDQSEPVPVALIATDSPHPLAVRSRVVWVLIAAEIAAVALAAWLFVEAGGHGWL